MRRIALIAALLAAAAALVTAAAGAEDSHTYKIEFDNAFGIVKGSDVRVAGVNQGSVTSLDVNESKRAVVSIDVSGPLSELGEDTTCSSEPQSLIAEYFIDCDPKGKPLPDGATIPVKQTTQTVQPDLVQNTLREPFKRRLSLLINEFGTALAGNPQNLNDAVRRGAPALRQLEQVLHILGDQNRIITNLNADSDRIMARLAERRRDVVSFIQRARDTATASAERRADLGHDFNRLDDFLAELRPTMARLGDLADQQTPLLTDLRASAPGLNRLAVNLPAFNAASEVSLESLGEAGKVGKKALHKGKDEIQQLKSSGRNAFDATMPLADLLRDLDDPGRAVEVDARAARDTGRPAPTGYSGLEGLLNYVYYQAGSINQFDQTSHLLHISLYDADGRCTPYNTGKKPGSSDFGVPDASDSDEGTTTNVLQANRCVNWLGPNQPRINEDIGTPRYDKSVCPEGSNAPELCDPNTAAGASASSGGGGVRAEGVGAAPGAGAGAPPGTLPGLPPNLGVGGGGGGGGHGHLPGNLDDLLPGGGGNLPGGGLPGGGGKSTQDLLNFLFGN
jgi:virulence factor Mce-like protein